jgi:N-acetylmuramoyl-L-alanine amidase
VVRVTVELDREVSFSQERIGGPARLFFDIKGSRTVQSLVDATFRYNSDVVRHIRFGRHPNRTTRIVLDFENVSTYSVFTLYNPFRIVIDAERTDRARVERPVPAAAFAPAPPPAPAPPLPARQFVANSMRRAPAVFPTRVTMIARPPPAPTPSPIPVTRTVPVPPRLPVTRSRTYAAVAVVAPVARESTELPSSVVEQVVENVPSDKAVMAGKPIAPSANSSGKFSVARQLGLGVSRIVIDAGHGGHDPGATAHGVSEAELVLDIALRLERLLSEQGMDVVLTRRKNEYISLDERTEIANRESADLFLSIHANASGNAAARGVETYFLNFALNPQAEAVAARENAASGMTMNSLPNIVRAITLNNKLNESRDFAASIQRALVKGMRPGNKALRDLGVKQAPFVVLIGASMPSVLAEVSFVTNRQEARLLKTPAYRQRIAESLLAGILRYQDSLKKVQTEARQ